MDSKQDLVNRVRELLAECGDVAEKRMFGSLAFMVNGHMCVTARESRIMCRVDPEVYDQLMEKAGCDNVVMKGRVYRGYVYVSADVIKTKRQLRKWIRLALDFNETLEPK